MSSADRVQDVLTAISEAAASYIDPRGLYPRIHQLVGWLMPARNLYIALYDARNDTVAMPYFVDQYDVPPGPEYRPMRHGLTEWVIRNRKPLLASQEVVDAMGRRGEVEVLGMPSLDWLGAPLLVGTDVIGVIALQSYTQDERFTERHRDLLSFVSQQIAMSLRRHQAESELRETTRRHAALVDNLPGVAFRCASDPDWTMEYMSEGVVELTGLTAAQLVGSREPTYASLMLEEDRPRVRGEIQAALKQRTAYTTEYRIRTAQGQIRWIWERGRGVFTNESLEAIEGFFVDATERMRAAEERTALETRLGQAQKMETVGRLAGGVAHDLNNLLVPILGYAEILSEDLEKDTPHLEMLAHIRTAAHRARDLTRQLLAFSRKQILELKTIDLAATVREFLKLITRTIREDIRMTAAIAAGPVRVRADVGQIEQVLMNLMLNAQDAMPEGGELSVRVSADDGHALIAVKDSGSGMDERTREHLFEPFFTTKGPGKGTGLGLSTVYGIVKQHGGDVEVDTQPGRGTQIRVSLPIVDEKDAAGESAVFESTERYDIGAGTVLLVEDNAAVREMTATILRRLGYTVVCTTGGAEALAHLARGLPVDLLLTDVVMPDMNGKDLATRARSLRADLRVLFTSGYTDDVIARHGILEDGVALLPKPFTPRALGEAVRAVLDARS